MPLTVEEARKLPSDRQEIEEELLEYMSEFRNAKEIADFLDVNVGGIYSKLIQLEDDGKIIREIKGESNLSYWKAVDSKP